MMKRSIRVMLILILAIAPSLLFAFGLYVLSLSDLAPHSLSVEMAVGCGVTLFLSLLIALFRRWPVGSPSRSGVT